MLIHEYNSAYVILAEDQRYNWLDELNEAIVKYLVTRGETTTDKVVRAYVREGYVVVQKYASLHSESLLSFLRDFLTDRGFVVVESELNPSQKELLKDYVPTRGLNGMLFGPAHPGNEQVSPSLPDPNIRPLCDAINYFGYLHTTASCEGHDNNSSAFVMFHAINLEALYEFTKLLEVEYVDIANNLGLELELESTFNYDHYSKTEVVFTIRFHYRISQRALFFKSLVMFTYLVKSKLDAERAK
jgi:hypothetical protein